MIKQFILLLFFVSVYLGATATKKRQDFAAKNNPAFF